MSAPVTLRRYVLPSQHGEGWATIVIGSDGYFSTVSDYGNYAYQWCNFGDRDFRSFLVSVDADYLRRKLDPSEIFDREATVRNLLAAIERAQHKGELTPDEADDETDRVLGIYSECEFSAWVWHLTDLDYDDYLAEALVMRPPGAIVGFVERIFPRFKALLREELGIEQAA